MSARVGVKGVRHESSGGGGVLRGDARCAGSDACRLRVLDSFRGYVGFPPRSLTYVHTVCKKMGTTTIACPLLRVNRGHCHYG